MSDTDTLLTSVAQAAAAAATDAAPAGGAVTTTATPPAAATTTTAAEPPAPPAGAAAASAKTEPFTARAALELTALAYPTMSASLTKLAAAADGGEAAFRSALLAERDTTAAPGLSTASTSTRQDPPKSRSGEDKQRGAGLKAAAQAQNAT